jgi:hypothetical protein
MELLFGARNEDRATDRKRGAQVSEEAQRDCAVLLPMKLCECHAKEYTRAAELTDDLVELWAEVGDGIRR